jgi:hypothetical protein
MVIFIGADGKEEAASIAPDGEYTLSNAPIGPCKIKLTRFPGAATATGPPPKMAVVLPGGPKRGPPPPDKYAAPDNGLTYEIKKGKQRFDIQLTP